MSAVVEALRTVYTEEPCELHTNITGMMVEQVALRFEDPSKVLRALDVGCGMGVAWPFLKDQFPNLAEIDVITPDDKERDNAKAHGHRVVGVTTEDYKRQITHCVYQLIWVRHSLEHSIMPFADLVAFRSMLDKDSILYVEVPAPDTVCGHEHNPNHYSVLTDKMWHSLFHKAGLEVFLCGDLKVDLEIGQDIYYWYIVKKKDGLEEDSNAE